MIIECDKTARWKGKQYLPADDASTCQLLSYHGYKKATEVRLDVNPIA